MGTKNFLRKYKGVLGEFEYDIREFEVETKSELDGNSVSLFMFEEIESLRYIGNGRCIRLPKGCMNCNRMFEGVDLEELDLRYFDTTGVVNMNSMFHDCTKLRSLDLSNFNTEDVINMANMFSDCIRLEYLDVSGFNTEKVTSMQRMFARCESLKSLDLSNFRTKSCKLMAYMFYRCESLRYLDISYFDTSTCLSYVGMFDNCKNIEVLDLGSFNIRDKARVLSMFQNCNNLKAFVTPRKEENADVALIVLQLTFQDNAVYITGNQKMYMNGDICEIRSVMGDGKISKVDNSKLAILI